MLSEPIVVTLQVIEALDALNVPYLIGRSFAAAVYGVARLTADADSAFAPMIFQARET